MGDFTFSGKERLRRETDIKTVFRDGVKLKCSGASLFVLPNGLQYNRFLCTFRRGFGSAVLRNRSRRISKEAYRQIKNRLDSGYDFVFLIFSEQTSFSKRYEQLEFLFKKAGVYADEVL